MVFDLYKFHLLNYSERIYVNALVIDVSSTTRIGGESLQ